MRRGCNDQIRMGFGNGINVRMKITAHMIFSKERIQHQVLMGKPHKGLFPAECPYHFRDIGHQADHAPGFFRQNKHFLFSIGYPDRESPSQTREGQHQDQTGQKKVQA